MPRRTTKPALKTQRPKKGYTMEDLSSNLNPRPELEDPNYKAGGKLKRKVALITGGDSGIGAATAIAFAKEGAKVAIVYYESDEDADFVVKRIEEIGGEALAIKGDVGDEAFTQKAVDQVTARFRKIDILVNNAGEQHPTESILDITAEQLDRTFRTNIFSMFYFVKAALPKMRKGGAIINTTSVTAYRGSNHLIDYASTKGAIVAFTRSLSFNKQILREKIRVNGVAPGPIWTPLIPASFGKGHKETFGKNVPLKRPGQPYEVAPSYVYLASGDASYVTGQVLHVNGGEVVGG